MRDAWFALIYAIWALGYGLRWFTRRQRPNRPSVPQGLLWMAALTTMAVGFVLDANHIPAWGQRLRQGGGLTLVVGAVSLALYDDERGRRAGVPRPALPPWLARFDTRGPLASWGYPLIGAVLLLVGSRMIYDDVPQAAQLGIIALLLMAVAMILFRRRA